MNKYTKYMLVLCILGIVMLILLRPSGKLLTRDQSMDYLALVQDAAKNHIPVLVEFYGKY